MTQPALLLLTDDLDPAQAALLRALHASRERLLSAPRDAAGELLPSGRVLTWLLTEATLRRLARREGLSEEVG